MAETMQPRVYAVGKGLYVSVRAGDAPAVYRYLRRHDVPCSPPQPYAPGMQYVPVGKADPASVRTLLSQWT
jgi:hypothetical protein